MLIIISTFGWGIFLSFHLFINPFTLFDCSHLGSGTGQGYMGAVSADLL